MATVHADVDIHATPKQILDVISDLPAYPQWSSVHRRAVVDERFADGRPRRATMAVAAAGLTDEQVIEYAWTKSAVSWDLVKSGQQRAQHGSYSISRQGNGVARVSYTLDITPAIPLPGFIVRRVMQKAVVAATIGLKQEVESRY